MSTELDVAAAWTQAELCPGCCTIDDIPPYNPSSDVLTPLVGCTRCGFRFPILPCEFKQVTFDSLRHHECSGAYTGKWQELGDAIVKAIHDNAFTGDELEERLGALWPVENPDLPVKGGGNEGTS